MDESYVVLLPLPHPADHTGHQPESASCTLKIRNGGQLAIQDFNEGWVERIRILQLFPVRRLNDLSREWRIPPGCFAEGGEIRIGCVSGGGHVDCFEQAAAQYGLYVLSLGKVSRRAPDGL